MKRINLWTICALSLVASCSRSSRAPAVQQAVARGDEPAVRTHLDHTEILTGKISTSETLAHGRSLFVASFNTLDGAGRPTSTGTGSDRKSRGQPQNFNRLSGPDANSCAGCHNKPRIGGGGDNVANVFVLAQRLSHANFDGGEGDHFETHRLKDIGNERNTLGMFGAGYIELLAREMTSELHAIRDGAKLQAQQTNKAVAARLVTKGTDFGSITASPNGSIDTSAVVGIDTDLVVKPFHQKGVVVSLREFTNNAMNHHHGMQSTERFGEGADRDGDGVRDELTSGDITAATLYQATLPAPGRVWPGSDGPALEAARKGEKLFRAIGCAACHTPELELGDPVFTEPNPYNPPGNMRPGDVAGTIAVDLTTAGSGPHLARESNGSVIVRAYTDLKRHDMGTQLDNERLVQGGVPTSHFLTRKLWGMANEGPYMHHGRALTLSEAILMHGGESKDSRAAFEKLTEADRAAVVEFLKTLQVLPEDAPSNEITGDVSRKIGDEPALVEGHVVQADIEAGKYSPERLVELGRILFGADFNTLDGAGRPGTTGTGEPRSPRSSPENFNRISGPDANACSGCHNQPAIGGGGENVANVFVMGQRLPHVNFDGKAGDAFQQHTLANVGNERNTPGMWGSGFVELLAREITADLHSTRDAALAEAKQSKQPVTRRLTSKGIDYGQITANPDGTIDARGVDGIDEDLVIKPFHQKGVVVSLRQFTNNALNHHHGMQTTERFGSGVDPDQDGKKDEITAGDVTALTLFQALLAVPEQSMPSDPALRASVEQGDKLFSSIGCAECHRQSLVLNNPVFTEPGPYNPSGNLRLQDVAKPYAVDLTKHGLGRRLPVESDGTVRVPVFTDFKRYDLGPACNNERLQQDGVATGHFLTRKLWGMASEPPYMHHGRALTLDEAITFHGGRAEVSRNAYLALSPEQRASIVDFLKTLQVKP